MNCTKGIVSPTGMMGGMVKIIDGPSVPACEKRLSIGHVVVRLGQVDVPVNQLTALMNQALNKAGISDPELRKEHMLKARTLAKYTTQEELPELF